MTLEASRVNRKLMAQQRHILPVLRTYYSRRDGRYFRWVEVSTGMGRRWMMLDLATGKRFGDPWPVVVFREDGFRASRPCPSRVDQTVKSEVKEWDDYIASRRDEKSGLIKHGLTGDAINAEKSVRPEAKMSPLMIALLCYRYEFKWPANDFEASRGFSPLPIRIADAWGELRKDGYAVSNPIGHSLTPKGIMFVEHLLAQPAPVKDEPKWRMPV